MASPAIRIAILANASQARSELDKTASAAEGIGAKFAKFRLPAALALGGIAAGGKAAINAASDLNEEVSKSEQIFGKQAAGIKKWAGTADTALGQSKQQALAAASTFGLIGQKAGLSGAQTGDFSKKFVGLASDLASFNNTTPQEAIDAIGAAMRGEAEPIRKYGVLLDDATLRARALKMGLIANVKQALTPQQKALAASQEILAQTSKAQGDFARTSSGAANKSRILAAQQENVKAKLGQGLLPAYQAVLNIMSKFASFASQHTGLIKGIVIAVGALAAIVLVASAAQKVYTAGMVIYNAVATTVKAVTAAWRTAQFLLNIALMANPIGVVVVAIVALIAVIVLAWKKSETFRDIIIGTWNAIKAAAGVVWEAIKNAISAVIRAIGAVISVYFNTYKAIILGIWTAIRTATSAVWNGIKTAVSAAVGFVADVLRGMRDRVTGIFAKAGGWLLNAGKAIIQGLLDGIGSMISAVTNKLKSLTNLIPKVKGPLRRDKRLLKPAGQAIMGGLIDSISAAVPELRRTLDHVSSTVQNGISAAPAFAVSAGGATAALDAVSGASGSAGSTTINLTVDGALDPTATARQIVTILTRLASDLGISVAQLLSGRR